MLSLSSMLPNVQSMVGMSRRRASAGQTSSRSAKDVHHHEETMCKVEGHATTGLYRVMVGSACQDVPSPMEQYGVGGGERGGGISCG